MTVTRAFVVAVMLTFSGVSTAAEDPYNLGVGAWRKKDYAEAAHQWSLAALSGEVNALNNLGYLYDNGMGVAQDHGAAVKLWLLAAHSGQSESQWHLGIAYEQGTGVPKDLVVAYAWFGCAVDNAKRLAPDDSSGTESNIAADAQESLAAVSSKLDKSELERAEHLRTMLVQRYGIAAP